MFITFEGGEGSGKTSQIMNVSEYFKSLGIDFIVTREPGDGIIGQQIRALLLTPENEEIVPMSELLLYMADRAQHIEKKILPNLKSGKIVLCDRFFDSSAVYQGIVGQIGLEKFLFLHKIIFDNLKPDLTFLLDLPADVGLRRTWKMLNSGSRTNDESRFERKAIEFHKGVRRGFLQIAKSEPNRFRVINAEVSSNEVWEEIKKVLEESFKI